LLINICLTILGYFPGHIHAFYLEVRQVTLHIYAPTGQPIASPRSLFIPHLTPKLTSDQQYIYYKRHDAAVAGRADNRRAAGIYSENIQTGGHRQGQGYGTMAPAGVPGAVP
jgi:hypothetical protein